VKKFYITTSIPYVNAPPHIGFALEAVQADVIARYHRLLKEDVFFLTGTDEHGIKIARKAEEAGKSPREFVNEISERFRELKKALNLSTDDFVRTTDAQRHWPSVEKVWNKIKERGDIYKKKYRGLYCVGHEAFILEKELVGGRCPIHQKEPEVVEEENYFFRLSKYADKLKKAISRNKIKIIPETKKKEALNLINQGLEDISCSRLRESVKWGIPVPGDDSQIIYIWFEALINYISALGYAENSPKFKKLWPADLHCVGKDIFKFHSLVWPAMLLSCGLDLPKKIFVHGFINVAGQKMSKSLGNIVNPFELAEKYGTDPVRYFLLREVPPTEDGDFTYERFEERYNSDLASGIGNLLSRVSKMAEKTADSEGRVAINIKNAKEVIPQIKRAKINYGKYLGEFRFNESLKSIWELIGFCDKYCDTKRPWEGGEGGALAIKNLLYVLAEIGKMLAIFLPETSAKILNQVKIISEKGRALTIQINKKGPLFPRLDK